MEKDADEGASMAEQIPEAWVGQEVIVYFEPGHRQARSNRCLRGVSLCDPRAKMWRTSSGIRSRL
jgi:hypothetical protein